MENELVPSNTACIPNNNIIFQCGPDDANITKKKSVKAPVTWLKLTGLNLLAFGLELCASAGFTYIPPIMLKSGFSEKTLTIVLGIGPFISLLLVPIIGHWSDKCQSRFGRRRPFMLFLGLLMMLSLLIIPFSKEVFVYTQGIMDASFTLAAGIVLLDFTSQALMNPCKALIPDIFSSSEEQNSGFTVYSCMLSMGGCIGYLITSINWGATHLGTSLGGQEKAVFSVLSIFLFILLLINLSLAKETPLQVKKMSLDNCLQCMGRGVNSHIKTQEKELLFVDGTNGFIPLKRSVTYTNGFSLQYSNNHNVEAFRNSQRSFLAFIQNVKWRNFSRNFKLCLKYTCCCIFYPLKFTSACDHQGFFNMPPALWRLFIASLFGWMGIMCHDMYYSDFVGQVIYQGKPQAEEASIAMNLYDEGVRMGSWGLLLHCLSAAVYAAFIQEHLINRYGQRKIYLFGILVFSLSLLGTVLTNSLILVNIFAALTGLGLAAITTVPYSLVTEYYNSKEMYYGSNEDRGVGEDMAVLDSAFYLSQIIPSIFLGYIVNITGSSATYMVVAALCGAAAFYSAFFITFPSHFDNVENKAQLAKSLEFSQSMVSRKKFQNEKNIYLKPKK